MKTALIFGAGIFGGDEPIPARRDLVVAADGGLDAAKRAGCPPDVAVGDFDSAQSAPPPGCETVRLPREKDITDGFAAAEEAVKRGCGRLLFYGMLGGRPDHSFANLAMLARLSKQGADARLYGAGYEITAVTDGAITYPPRKTGTVSVFSFTDKSEGVTLKGLKYPLTDAVMTNDFGLGVSNERTGEAAEIRVRRGTLIVMTDFLRSV